MCHMQLVHGSIVPLSLMEIRIHMNRKERICLLNVCVVSSPGLNRTVVYSLLDSVTGFFSIDAVSGMVILEKSLDRESRDSYRVRVQATDQAGQQGALSSQVCRAETQISIFDAVQFVN